MKKIFLALAACSLLAAGCEVRREGYQFIITTQGPDTVIEGSQASWDMRPSFGSSISPLGSGLSLPQVDGISLPLR
jgi:hypothetical protein